VKGVAVIDASLAATWGMPEAFTDRALALAGKWVQEGIQPVTPSLILPEITNAFYKRVIRGETDLATVIEALHVILDFGIEIREEPGLHAKAMELSHQMAGDEMARGDFVEIGRLHAAQVVVDEADPYCNERRIMPPLHRGVPSRGKPRPLGGTSAPGPEPWRALPRG